MSLRPPTEDHLSRIYYELGKIGARAVGSQKKWPYHPKSKELLFALAAEWSRWDPRLLEIVVQYGLQRWKELKPQSLREAMTQMETPQTFGVMASFIQRALPEDKELHLFWDYVTAYFEPVEEQFYFRDLYLPGSRLAERAARESLVEFKKWGFLGRERIIVDPTTKRCVGTWDQTSRQNILRRLLKQKGTIQISDYLEEIAHTISRQQALQDLKLIGARQNGKGRGASWRL